MSSFLWFIVSLGLGRLFSSHNSTPNNTIARNTMIITVTMIIKVTVIIIVNLVLGIKRRAIEKKLESRRTDFWEVTNHHNHCTEYLLGLTWIRIAVTTRLELTIRGIDDNCPLVRVERMTPFKRPLPLKPFSNKIYVNLFQFYRAIYSILFVIFPKLPANTLVNM